MENKSKELEVAIEAALEAGKVLRKFFETEILREEKEDTSIVTEADRESEEVIKKILSSSFPDHSIFGEEGGKTGDSEYVWHVDPVDGTRNFANGIPIFCVSIAMAFKNDLIVGVVYNPATNSLFYAEKGKGAYLNDKKIHVSKDDPAHSMITISPGKVDELLRSMYFDFPKKIFRSTRDLGATALELAYVARGGLEANIQLGFQKTYDFAAGALLVLESGGTITKHNGEPWVFPESELIASNGVFHDKIVEEVRKQKEKLNI